MHYALDDANDVLVAYKQVSNTGLSTHYIYAANIVKTLQTACCFCCHGAVVTGFQGWCCLLLLLLLSTDC
jgi:hypothetical protein